MTMRAPSRAARIAIALPMPRLAPVMKSVFPRSVESRVFESRVADPGSPIPDPGFTVS
jgi:hypothetical protein